MRPKEKTKLRVQIATRAVVAALEAYNNRNPGKCIVKPDLIPHIVRRAGWIMEDDDDPIYDIEAIAPPNEQFICNRWPEICLQAAEEHHKYIVWEHRVGVRLGTFEEYQQTREILAGIAQGLVDNVDDRNEIVIKQGGQSFSVDIRIKQLPSGNGKLDKEAE